MPATSPLSDTTLVGANFCWLGPSSFVLSSSKSRGWDWYWGGLSSTDSNSSGTQTKPYYRENRENTAKQSMYNQQHNSSQIPPTIYVQQQSQQQQHRVWNIKETYSQTMPSSKSYLTGSCVTLKIKSTITRGVSPWTVLINNR